MSLSIRARRLAVPLTAFLLGLGILALTFLLTLAPPRSVGPSGIGGPFSLVDQDGRSVTEKSVAGRPYLVFFGFTHCPDVCPTTLFQMSEVLQAMGRKADGLRALFITVDPERDTPEVLKTYLGSFDDRITGLTGDRASVDAAIRTFKTSARKVPGKDGDYAMEHSSSVYLMNRNNEFVGTVNLSRAPEETAQDLQKQL